MMVRWSGGPVVTITWFSSFFRLIPIAAPYLAKALGSCMARARAESQKPKAL